MSRSSEDRPEVAVVVVMMWLAFLSVASRLASTGVAAWMDGEESVASFFVAGGLALMVVSTVAGLAVVLHGSSNQTVVTLLAFVLVWPVLEWATIAVYLLVEGVLGTKTNSRLPVWRWVVRKAKRLTLALRARREGAS